MATTTRLLFVSNLFPARESAHNGLDNAVLLHHLQASFDIRVLCPKPIFPPWKKLTYRAREEDMPLNPSYVPVAYIPRIGSRWNDKLMRGGIRLHFKKLVQEWKPDSILCSWLYPDACAVSQLAHEYSTPCDLITQGSDTHQYLKSSIRRHRIMKAIKISRQVICRSDDLAQRLEKAGAEKRKLKTIYNGINTDHFNFRNCKEKLREKLHLPQDVPILLFAGNFLPIKNPLLLLEILAALQSYSHPSARLVMIGDGPMRESIQKKANSLGIQDSLLLPGSCTSEQVAEYMNAADIFCLSSHNEGMPNVILESLACGLPVISTKVGGIGEILNNEAFGKLVPVDSIDAYVTAISDKLEKPLQRTAIAEYGQQFTWQESANQYLQAIQLQSG